MVRDPEVLTHWNTFGRKCFDIHYHAENFEQIEDFINRVVIGGEDTLRMEREQFCTEYLFPKDGVMPSQKVMDILLSEIKGN